MTSNPTAGTKSQPHTHLLWSGKGLFCTAQAIRQLGVSILDSSPCLLKTSMVATQSASLNTSVQVLPVGETLFSASSVGCLGCCGTKTRASSGAPWMLAEPLLLTTVSARWSAEFWEETELYIDRQDHGHCGKKAEGEVSVCVSQ